MRIQQIAVLTGGARSRLDGHQGGDRRHVQTFLTREALLDGLEARGFDIVVLDTGEPTLVSGACVAWLREHGAEAPCLVLADDIEDTNDLAATVWLRTPVTPELLAIVIESMTELADVPARVAASDRLRPARLSF